MESAKTCTQCQETKPPGAFYPAERMRDGRMSKCKVCTVEARRAFREREKVGGRSLLRNRQTAGNGELLDETLTSRRDEYIVFLAASVDRWRNADDQEDRDGAREALLFRCRQLLEAEGLVCT